MGFKTISDGDLVINGVSVAYAGNTLSYNDGLGDREVRAQSAGGTSVTVFSEDVTTQVGGVKFSLENTDTNLALLPEWHSNGNDNLISLTKDDFRRSFNSAVMMTSPDVALSSDGVTEIEFKSDKAV